MNQKTTSIFLHAITNENEYEAENAFRMARKMMTSDDRDMFKGFLDGSLDANERNNSGSCYSLTMNIPKDTKAIILLFTFNSLVNQLDGKLTYDLSSSDEYGLILENVIIKFENCNCDRDTLISTINDIIERINE